MYTRENPSPEYLDSLQWSQQYHRTSKVFTGRRTFKVYPSLKLLVQRHNARTLLDYGCGKGEQFRLQDIAIADPARPMIASLVADLGCQVTGYDPAVPEYEILPAGQFDGVLVSDVLKYIPLQDFPWICREISNFAIKFVLYTVSLQRGKKPFGDQHSREYGRILEDYLRPIEQHTSLLVDVACRVKPEGSAPFIWLRRQIGQQTWERSEGPQLLN